MWSKDYHEWSVSKGLEEGVMACLMVRWNSTAVFLQVSLPLFSIQFHRSGVSKLSFRFDVSKICHIPSRQTLLCVSTYYPGTHLETLRKTMVPLSFDNLWLGQDFNQVPSECNCFHVDLFSIYMFLWWKILHQPV